MRRLCAITTTADSQIDHKLYYLNIVQFIERQAKHQSGGGLLQAHCNQTATTRPA
jgi:hypothetical protein